MSILSLDDRRRNVFGRTNIKTAPQVTVPHAVKEINHQPNREPDDEPDPGHHRQAQHQRDAQEHAEQWKYRDERDAKWTRAFGSCPPQHVYAETNKDKGKKRPDVR